MNILDIEFSDIAFVDGLEFRRKISSSNKPVVVVVHYRIMPFVTIMFFPPLNSIWRMYPSKKICNDQDMREDDLGSKLMVEEEIGKIGEVAPISGVFNLADIFERTNKKTNIGCWRFRFNVKCERLGEIHAYLQNWWSSLGEECIARVDDGAVWQSSWWEKQWNFIKGNDCCHFMLRLWELDHAFFNKADKFIQAERSMDDVIIKASKVILPTIEAVSSMPGKVMRKMIIQSGMPNKRISSPNIISYQCKLKERDMLYYKQCLIVRRLNRVSMYWNIKEAINDFNDSLRLHDYSYAKSPIKELQCYVEEMAEKFPILKQD